MQHHILKILFSFFITFSLIISGCSDDNPSNPSSIKYGTIIIRSVPDSLSGSWTLSGPGNYLNSGTGDMTRNDFVLGSYTLEWNDIPNWTKPSPHIISQILISSEPLEFIGTYGSISGYGTINIVPDPAPLNAP